MKTSTFHWNSIRWLRQEMRLGTETVPASPIDDVRAPMDVPGFLARSTFPRRCAYVGLWVLALGLVLAMTGTPALSLETRAVLRELGQSMLVLGGLLELVALVVSRLGRDRVLVELRPAAAGPATAASIRELHHRAQGGVAWVVGAQTPEPAALALAAGLGVRCFVPGLDAETWREHAAPASPGASTHGLPSPIPSDRARPRLVALRPAS